jgi:hypothetical protein
MYVSFVEMGVFNYPDPRMKGWRFYRIEYGGHAEDCIMEKVIWVPPWIDVYEWEKQMNGRRGEEW